MTVRSPRDLPTIEQRIDAEALSRFLSTCPSDLTMVLPDLRETRQPTARRPSQQLWQQVKQATQVVYRAGHSGTAVEHLRPYDLERLARGRQALYELAAREHRALDGLQADPPAFLIAAIGRPPASGSGDAVNVWRRLAGRVQAYRIEYGVTDPTHALGQPPTHLARRADWGGVLQDIVHSPAGLEVRALQPAELSVFSRRNPGEVLRVLSDPAWKQVPLSDRQTANLQAASNPVLRGKIGRALALLEQRPQDRSGEINRLRASRRDLEVMAAAHQGSQVDPDERMQLARNLHRIDTSLKELHHRQQQRSAWDRQCQRVMAAAVLATEELARREVAALLALQDDPPRYLHAELGSPPTSETGRARWCRAARLIEQHRLHHRIDDPDLALGAKPADSLDLAAYGRVRDQLDAIKHEAPGRALDPPQPTIDIPTAPALELP